MWLNQTQMNLIQRIKNLWTISGWESSANTNIPTHILHNLEGKTETTPIHKMAQIIKRVIVDPLEEALKDENSTI